MGGRPSTRELKAWLFKSDPDSFAWRDLLASPGRTTRWDGIRNYQVRNMIRDAMGPGDRVLFYHSSADPAAVLGTAEVVGRATPDPTQFDESDPHYDAKADPESPRWYAIEIRADRELPQPVTLAAMRASPALAGLVLLRKGTRLSILPVTPAEWDEILRMGASRETPR